MDHQDHIQLLEGGVPGSGGVWADFGSGTGAFTLALAQLIGATGTIYSIDKDSRALYSQARQVKDRFPGVTLHIENIDYTNSLALPPLDGIVMANALHFQRRKEPVIRLLRSYLRHDGHFIVIEYNSDSANPWVPYPLSYRRWETLASECGFTSTRLLHTRPSRFMGAIYSALSINSNIG